MGLNDIKMRFGRWTRAMVLALGLGGTAVVGMGFATDYFEISKNLDIFISVYGELHSYYVDETNPGELMKTGIEAMLASLDPYTNYIPESDIEDYRFMTTGQYGGIGALIRTRGKEVIVAESYEGFASDKAGLLPGDVILQINGKSTEGKDTEDVSKALKGQPGSEVKLLVKRPGQDKPFTVNVKREEIKINSVPYHAMLEGDVGYINLSSFTESCTKDVYKALTELKGKGMKKLVLDLRGNPGGLLNEAVSMSNLFVNKGEMVVSTRGKVEEWNKVYHATSAPAEKDMPVAVLVNRGSASASEIVAGVLQDLDRGIVVGERTYGKGLVQTTRPLSYNSQLKVTTAKYYIPSGRCIQAINYADHNEDGSVAKVPDSLRVAHKTRAGRTVYDGGGIEPDVAISPMQLSDIAFSLGEKFIIFDFATQYRQKHETLPGGMDFKVDDALYNEFVQFIDGKDYDYTTESEHIMEDLKEAATEEKYFGRAEAEYKALLDKLKHNKTEDVKIFKDEIVDLLQAEIISRYFYQRGRIASMLQRDREVQSAVDALKDEARYKGLLSGKK